MQLETKSGSMQGKGKLCVSAWRDRGSLEDNQVGVSLGALVVSGKAIQRLEKMLLFHCVYLCRSLRSLVVEKTFTPASSVKTRYRSSTAGFKEHCSWGSPEQGASLLNFVGQSGHPPSPCFVEHPGQAHGAPSLYGLLVLCPN